ncbi:MAG: hypothetical protein AVDCRST_MAG40-632 [uncultured Gemmatimonadaceae bacterium]|uniref:Uncharacterized protein n=1 Tax=uncultured Gemmatimonadaceae bacterium TaxID=246130 RepID=A0A6J4KGH1_9BACT|nr:MAG: hypothetical protein AVDCRST_MAG40-632 [uncultured Gemmatimonadaceae bacterium]
MRAADPAAGLGAGAPAVIGVMPRDARSATDFTRLRPNRVVALGVPIDR